MRRARAFLVATAALAGVLAAVPVAAQSAKSDARALVDGGQPERALALLDDWLRKNPKDAEGHLLRSTALFLTGDSPGGASALDRALELDPDLRQGWLNRGALELAEGDYDGALAAFREAERIDPQADDNAINIGAVLLLQGELSAATERFRRYLELNPGSAEAYYLVASNYAMTGFVQPAIQALGYAIQIDEKSRRRARVDPNFSDVARDQRFQELLATDSFRPAAGSLAAHRDYDSGFTGPNSRILRAVIRSLEIVGEPFDRQIEVADDWALVWTESFRLKISRLELATTRVEVTAPPGSAEPEAWRQRADTLFRTVPLELLKISRSATPSGAQSEP